MVLDTQNSYLMVCEDGKGHNDQPLNSMTGETSGHVDCTVVGGKMDDREGKNSNTDPLSAEHHDPVN